MEDTIATTQSELRRTPSWTLAASVLGVALLLLIILLGWRGYQDGLAIRAEREREAAALYVARADALTSVGEVDLAEQDLIEALRLAPDYPAAQERLSQLHRQTTASDGPTARPGLAAPVPVATPAPGPLLADARRAMQAGAWNDAIQLLTTVRELDSTHEADAVTDLLYRANMADGLYRVETDDVAGAIQRFEAALKEQPQSAEAAEQLELIRLYADAIARWDQDWSYTTSKLDALFERAPNFKDVPLRLASAYVVQGDLLMDQRRPCQAVEVFARAAIITDEADIRARQQAARQACQTGSAAVRQAPTLTPRIVETRETPGAAPQVAGQIVDGQGRPLGGFVVTATGDTLNRQALSDPTGMFIFPDLSPGAYMLDVPEGYGPALSVRAAPEKLIVVEFRGR